MSDKEQNIDSPEHWKNKYYKCVKELQDIDSERQDAERNLLQDISRLIQTIKVMEPGVGKGVDQLQQLLQQDTGNNLQEISHSIKGLLHQLAKGKGKGADMGDDARSYLTQFLSKLSLSAERQTELQSVLQRLSKKEKQEPLEKILLDVADLLHDAYHTAEGGDQALTVAEAQILIQLLDQLSLPDDLTTLCNNVKNKLQQNVTQREIPSILKTVADLIIFMRRRFETERREVQHFLQQTNLRLQELDQLVVGASDDYASAQQHRDQFGQEVQAHMEGLADTVAGAADLDLLKKEVAQRLKHVRTHIEQHRQADSARDQDIRDKVGQMNQRLRELEHEAQQLRTRLQERYQQAILDPLTGAFNRLGYEERMEQEINRFHRYQTPFSLVVVDIDFFKRINDDYGHLAGDKVLQVVTEIAKEQLRNTDYLARYGGEEFAIIMPETKLKDALAAANKLRQQIEQWRFHYNDKDVRVTISCGVAQIVSKDDKDKLFQRADQALYKAKHQGRNQVCG